MKELAEGGIRTPDLLITNQKQKNEKRRYDSTIMKCGAGGCDNGAI